MYRKEKIRILVLITHSLSEINVLYPLFSALSGKPEYSIDVVFTVRKIYHAYKDDDFLQYCEKKLAIKTGLCQFPNKFDGSFGRIGRTLFGRRIAQILSVISVYVKFPLLAKKLLMCDFYMHEISNQRNSTRLLYLGQLVLGKKILTYHHGSEISIDKVAYGIKPKASRSTMLVFHAHNSSYMNDLGYHQQSVIGYPVFFPEWRDLVNDYPTTTSLDNKVALIYSRHITDRYMDEDKYSYLLRSSLRVLGQKLGDVPIVIKPHPREDVEEIEYMLRSEKLSQVTISFEHPAVLARRAKVAVAFWGSVVLESLSMGIPTVEYYIEARKFREDYPSGSNYKAVGIHSVSDENGFANFVDSVLNKSYRPPPIVNELSSSRNLAIFRHN